MNEVQIQEHIEYLSRRDDLPKGHVDYLSAITQKFNFEPKVIYDIGANVLHWTKEARKIWPKSKFYLFDGTDTIEFLYKKLGYDYHIAVLSDTEKDVVFYQSSISPGGNSYYQEDSWATEIYYGKENAKTVRTQTVDTIVKNREFLYADLIKIDVQGCEIDVLKGMNETIKHCKHLIIELQHRQYNKGAPLNTESVPFIESLGFELVTPLFHNNGSDGDYHFINKMAL